MQFTTTLPRSLCALLGLVLVSAFLSYANTSTRNRLIADVARLGGTVEFDENFPGRPIAKVDLHGTKVTDSDLAMFEYARNDLKELRYLDLRLTQISDDGVARLKNLRQLQTLNLFRTRLGDKGLAQLKKLTDLRTLLIGGTQVTDAGLVHLRRFSKLRKLSLFQTPVSDNGIAELKRMSSLEVVLISGSKITAAGAEELRKALPRVSFKEDN
jgi:hypothetical protein